MLRALSHRSPRGAAPLLLAAGLAVCSAASGCLPDPGEAEPPAAFLADIARQDAAERADALALLGRADATAFRGAFATLQRASFRRYARTEQRDADDALLAYETRTVRRLMPPPHSPEPPRYVRLDSTRGGTFEFGLFQRFVSANVGDLDTDDLVPFVLPEDPPYLEPRRRDAYYFWLGPDSLLGRVQARQVRVRAKPGEADGQNIRRAAVYLHPHTHRVLAAELDRVDLAMLFREESAFYVHVDYLSDSLAVPVNTRFRSRLRTPFRPPQVFATRASYSDLALP